MRSIAVVTGGTKGIGLAFSRRLIELGYLVHAPYRQDGAAAERAAADLGGDLLVEQCDIGDPDQVADYAARIGRNHAPVTVLVNNAGLNIDRPFLDLTVEDWRQVIDINLSGPFYLTRAFAPGMIAAGGGSVVNLGATTAIRPRRNGANYCASKAGLLHLTKCLALELAPLVRVNCLIPGMIETEEMVTRFRMREPEHEAAVLAEIPQGRVGTVEEMADALEFLVGERSRYVTGQRLIVDGGQFMW